MHLHDIFSGIWLPIHSYTNIQIYTYTYIFTNIFNYQHIGTHMDINCTYIHAYICTLILSTICLHSYTKTCRLKYWHTKDKKNIHWQTYASTLCIQVSIYTYIYAFIKIHTNLNVYMYCICISWDTYPLRIFPVQIKLVSVFEHFFQPV